MTSFNTKHPSYHGLMAEVHPEPAYLKLGGGMRHYYQYSVSPLAWEFMRTIPGSFAAEEQQRNNGCPIEAMYAAYYDLLPTLLKRGHEGKELAFGYGREWYAVGKDGNEAMGKLLKKYPEQRPKLLGTIRASHLERWDAKLYFEWKTGKQNENAPSP